MACRSQLPRACELRMPFPVFFFFFKGKGYNSHAIQFTHLKCSMLLVYSEASLIAQLVKNPPAMQETPVQFLGREDLWRRGRLPTSAFLGFPCGSASKESACNAGDLSLIPGLGRSPGEGKGYPLQYSGLENSMDCIVQGVTKLDTTERLSQYIQSCTVIVTITFRTLSSLQKEMLPPLAVIILHPQMSYFSQP